MGNLAGEGNRVCRRDALVNLPSVHLLTAPGFAQTGTEQVSFYQDEQGAPLYFDGGIFRRKLGAVSLQD